MIQIRMFFGFVASSLDETLNQLDELIASEIDRDGNPSLTPPSAIARMFRLKLAGRQSRSYHVKDPIFKNTDAILDYLSCKLLGLVSQKNLCSVLWMFTPFSDTYVRRHLPKSCTRRDKVHVPKQATCDNPDKMTTITLKVPPLQLERLKKDFGDGSDEETVSKCIYFLATDLASA